MAKRKRSENSSDARRSADATIIARKLISLRIRREHFVVQSKKPGGLLDAQKIELHSIMCEVTRLEKQLSQRGLPQSLINSSKHILANLKDAHRKPIVSNARSGGVGLYALGKSGKFWR